MTLPNFLIIGAPKAGTTSLYSYFREHPAIFMPELKEPRFFGYEGQGDRIRFPVRTLEEYTALFDAVTTETAIGEATPHYLVYPVAAQRIRDLLPEVRLIASLRDPVDRAYSVYQMNLRNKGVNTGVPFVEAIKSDHNLRETYADMLGRYVALFPPGQLKVILLEDLEADPRGTVRALFEFLGVDPGFVPDLSKIANPGGEPRNKLLHGLLSDPRLRVLSRRLLPPGAVDRLRTLRSRNLAKQPLAPEDRRDAIGLFRDDILRTQDLIGRDLAAWLRA
jgi:Sulfotransferase domain